MRVLHLVNSLNRGGIEIWLISLLRIISHDTYHMDICCRGESVGIMAEEARDLGATVYHIPFGIFHLGFYLKLRQCLMDGQYDILHNHMETYSGFATWIGKQLGITVINSFHNTDSPPQTKLTRRLGIRQMRQLYGRISINYAIKNSDCITGCSQSVLESLHIENKINSRILYYGINIPPRSSEQDRDDLRREFGWSITDPIIIHVGRFYEQKNHAGILSIFGGVKNHAPDVRLVLVGDGILKAHFEAYVREKDLTDDVKFLGIRDDVIHLLGCSDIFLMPSLYEGFGIAAIEANAVGLPVIATRTTGLQEAIADGETGLLFDIDEITAMSEAILKLLTQPDERKHLGEQGRQRVIEKFSTQVSAQELERLYDACNCLG